MRKTCFENGPQVTGSTCGGVGRALALAPTISTMAIGPGLKKAKLPPLLRERWVRLLAVTEGRVRDLVDGADIVSEGGMKDEAGVPTYYGTTHLIIRADAFEGIESEVVAHVLRSDPHTRLRVVRVAHREATSRILGRPSRLLLDIEIDIKPNCITIAVDVVARVTDKSRAIAE